MTTYQYKTRLRPIYCDICKAQITATLPDETAPFSWFADAKTKLGPWAIVCPDCHRAYCYKSFGPGLGQKYSTEPPYTKLAG